MSWSKLARWEWFKLRGRRIIWVLLAALTIFSSLMVVIRYADYEFQKGRDVVDEIIFLPDAPVLGTLEVELNCTEFLAGVPITGVPEPYSLDDIDLPGTNRKCRQELEGIQSRLDKLVDAFTMPGAAEKALRWTGMLSIPLVAFLSVLVVGSEYGWGTLRTSLMKGPGRWRFLSVKLVLIAAAMAIAWLVILIVIVASSVVTTALARYGETRISVSCRVSGDGVVARVVDDGPGIAPADRERVFERFVRLDESRDRHEGGTGLGLAVARAIARSYGGDVQIVDSTSGATVEVTLPSSR